MEIYLGVTAFILLFFAAIGACSIGLWLGKISYRWTMAIDELLRQRAERKKEGRK